MSYAAFAELLVSTAVQQKRVVHARHTLELHRELEKMCAAWRVGERRIEFRGSDWRVVLEV